MYGQSFDPSQLAREGAGGGDAQPWHYRPRSLLIVLEGNFGALLFLELVAAVYPFASGFAVNTLSPVLQLSPVCDDDEPLPSVHAMNAFELFRPYSSSTIPGRFCETAGTVDAGFISVQWACSGLDSRANASIAIRMRCGPVCG